MRSVLVGLLVLFCGICAAPSNADPCHPAELFVADNAEPLFELQADATIVRLGVAVAGSTPLDGVWWSDARRQLSFERSREFHLCSTDPSSLHRAGEALRRQFDQESVLSFDYLPQQAPPRSSSRCPTSTSRASVMRWAPTRRPGPGCAADRSPRPITP